MNAGPSQAPVPLTVVADHNDRRLTNQDQYLLRAALTWRRYRARSETWEHDHCAFCWAKFMDPEFSEAHRQHIAEHPDVFTEGYTTIAEHEQGAEYHWICKPCFDDFVDRFQWRIVESS